MIPAIFINHAADVLGDTVTGLSGSRIASYCSAYAVQFGVDIPYSEYPFPRGLANKRAALRANLKAFSPEQQFAVIKGLCELEELKAHQNVKDLKIKLMSRYGHLNPEHESDKINEALVEETRHWLNDYPEVLRVYEDALGKYEAGIYQRNLLDDLRLCLELLLKNLLINSKSLENQLPLLMSFAEKSSVSAEMRNMLLKLIDYYSKYHNSYIKHNDEVRESEIEIIMEMTCSFMKFLIKIKN
jgi:hypothetical protein